MEELEGTAENSNAHSHKSCGLDMQEEAAIGTCCRCGGGTSPCSHMFEFCQFGELHLMVCILLTAGSRVDHSNG